MVDCFHWPVVVKHCIPEMYNSEMLNVTGNLEMFARNVRSGKKFMPFASLNILGCPIICRHGT